VPDVFALDTNVYVHALRTPQRLALLKRFLLRVGTRVRMHAMVALELRAGARSGAHQEAVEALLAPYAERERLVVPTYEAYLHAGRVIASVGAGTSDAIVAASCRESNVVLVTGDADYGSIQKRLRGFRFLTPARAFGDGW
jgi:predicted nucleic acid-binding protein